MELENLWQTVLAQIQLNISPANFATWFNNTKIISLEKDVITVSVPNSFSKEWLEQKYSKDILKIIHSIDENIKSIVFVVDPGKTKKITSSKKTVSREDILTEQLGFNELEVNKETNLKGIVNFAHCHLLYK